MFEQEDKFKLSSLALHNAEVARRELPERIAHLKEAYLTALRDAVVDGAPWSDVAQTRQWIEEASLGRDLINDLLGSRE
ncbi:hypothetical protein [Phenylobacterium sp.]|uniref:hypothetical protein n=1 Tax=Phenylobacterium sp. TaxID=1871053 RepID=UPI0025DA0653|nr:hypothetical protein [Phenylobacterium sp.]